MSDHWKDLLPGFDAASYYAGMTYAFVEIVAAGVKRLALSPPYSAEDLAVMLEPTRLLVEQFGITMYVEHDLIVTSLFPADVAQDKSVILLAQTQDVVDDYLALKARGASLDELAWSFGRMLSYTDERIAGMLEE